MAQATTEGSGAVTARELMLRNALSNAIEQLEGWVNWKCPKKHLAEHQQFLANLRAVRDHKADDYAAFIKSCMSADEVFRAESVKACLDVLLRMVPGYCSVMGVEQCTDAEHNEAIHRAAIAVHGPDAGTWPKAVVDVVAGKLE